MREGGIGVFNVNGLERGGRQEKRREKKKKIEVEHTKME